MSTTPLNPTPDPTGNPIPPTNPPPQPTAHEMDQPQPDGDL